MADEQIIGVAQLRLEAEYKDFVGGLERVQKELDKGEGAFAKFSEKGEKAGARMLNAQRQTEKAVLELTGTATEKALAAVDARYEAQLAKARRAGADTTALERAIHEEKHRILMESEAKVVHYFEAVEATSRRVNPYLQEEERRTSVAMQGTGQAAEQVGGTFKKTQVAALQLAGALGTQTGEAGRAANALVGLLTFGLNPVAIASAALVATIAAVVGKHREQAATAKAVTDAYRGMADGAMEYMVKMDVLQGRAKNEAEELLRRQIAQREREIIDLRRKASTEELRQHEAGTQALREKLFQTASLRTAEEERAKAQEEIDRANADRQAEQDKRYAESMGTRSMWAQHAVDVKQEEADRIAGVEAALVAEQERLWGGANDARVADEVRTVAQIEAIRSGGISFLGGAAAPAAAPERARVVGSVRSVNDGAGAARNWMPFAGAWVQPGGHPAPGGVTIINQAGVTFRDAGVRDGQRVLVATAQDILDDGTISRAIQDAFGLQRSGGGR